MQSNSESDRDEDFELEVVDIPAEEARSISGALVDLGYRFMSQWLHVGKIRNISPRSLLFLLVIVPLSSSSLYQNVSPNLQTTSSSVLTLVPGPQPTQKDASDFITIGQLQLSIWPGLSSDSSTIVLPGIALGHATKPGGPATWNAAPMPSNCVVDQSSDSPLYAGHISLLVASSSDAATVVHLPSMSSPTLDSWSGWEIPILIGMKFHFVGPITITLSNQYDGPTPSFSGVFDAHQRSSFSFDPNQETPGVTHIATKGRNFWMLHMYVAGAGCYVVHASWYGGFRQVTLSAGR